MSFHVCLSEVLLVKDAVALKPIFPGLVCCRGCTQMKGCAKFDQGSISDFYVLRKCSINISDKRISLIRFTVYMSVLCRSGHWSTRTHFFKMVQKNCKGHLDFFVFCLVIHGNNVVQHTQVAESINFAES